MGNHGRSIGQTGLQATRSGEQNGPRMGQRPLSCLSRAGYRLAGSRSVIVPSAISALK
jgi:hypothetical protein